MYPRSTGFLLPLVWQIFWWLRYLFWYGMHGNGMPWELRVFWIPFSLLIRRRIHGRQHWLSRHDGTVITCRNWNDYKVVPPLTKPLQLSWKLAKHCGTTDIPLLVTPVLTLPLTRKGFSLRLPEERIATSSVFQIGGRNLTIWEIRATRSDTGHKMRLVRVFRCVLASL